VELALMRSGEHDVARAYVLYRERRAAERPPPSAEAGSTPFYVVDGGLRPLDNAAAAHLRGRLRRLGDDVRPAACSTTP
jgi:ribonucleoside-diphosphate reductase alpha chain